MSELFGVWHCPDKIGWTVVFNIYLLLFSCIVLYQVYPYIKFSVAKTMRIELIETIINTFELQIKSICHYLTAIFITINLENVIIAWIPLIEDSRDGNQKSTA